jgi:broad specificity phosphatase PhoE
MRRLLLVRNASTLAMRRAVFAPEDPLDARGREAAAALRGALPSVDRALAAPLLSAFQTASLAGLAPVVTEPALADCDYGRWSGLALADVQRDEPDGVAAWLSDPDGAPHGGESVRALLARVAAWLEDQVTLCGPLVAVVPGSVVKAAVAVALDAPPSAFWRLDVAPAAITELHGRDGRWTVTRVNHRVAAYLRPGDDATNTGTHGRRAAPLDDPCGG